MAVKYPQRTTAQWPMNFAAHNERYREQWTGHLDQVSATYNERRRGQRPKPMFGITHVPLHHKRPAFAWFSARGIRRHVVADITHNIANKTTETPSFSNG
jgi:hypothetical protein